MIDVVTISSFLVIAGFVFITGQAAVLLQRDRLRGRLMATEGSSGNSDMLASEVLSPEAVDLLMNNHNSDTAIDQELRRAGWYRPTAKQEFSALRNSLVTFLLIATGVVCVVLGPRNSTTVEQVFIFAFVALILAWSLPRIYLRTSGDRRMKRIRRGLPDALDMMSMTLTGGLSLGESFAHVSREVTVAHPDLALEMLIIQKHVDMRSSEFAFKQFAHRVDVPEVSSLASLINQGQRLGTDVVTSIREFADSMRLQRRQAADERSSKASVKMLFPLTMCMLPSVFIILWGPSVLELWQFLQSFEGASG